MCVCARLQSGYGACLILLISKRRIFVYTNYVIVYQLNFAFQFKNRLGKIKHSFCCVFFYFIICFYILCSMTNFSPMILLQAPNSDKVTCQIVRLSTNVLRLALKWPDESKRIRENDLKNIITLTMFLSATLPNHIFFLPYNSIYFVSERVHPFPKQCI